MWRYPTELGKAEVEAYLTFLAVDERVAPSTQNQAFSAILFLYRKVLEMELPPIAAGRAKKRQRLPVVLSRSEVQRVAGHATAAVRTHGTTSIWNGDAAVGVLSSTGEGCRLRAFGWHALRHEGRDEWSEVVGSR